MKQYYFAIDGEQKGPISIQELEKLISSGEIKHNTQLWHTNLSEWQNAANVDEIVHLFSTPPPIPQLKKSKTIHETLASNQQPNPTTQIIKTVRVKEKRNNWMLYLMIIPLLGIGYYGFASYMNQYAAKKIERLDPKSYLQIGGLNNEIRMFKNDYVEGSVSNLSNKTTFGQIELLLEWTDKNSEVISITTHQLAENIRPLDSKKFKIPTSTPLRGKRYRVSVNNAYAISQ